MEAKVIPRPATWEDLDVLAEGERGEIVGGQIVLLPRPSGEHQETVTELGLSIGMPFMRGSGGPGGWVIVHEPEVVFADEIRNPDLAGWRLERYVRSDKRPYVVVPDWVCEVLSPSNEAKDRAEKLPLYARSGVPHVWLVDPIELMVEVYRLDGPSYRYVRTAAGAEVVALEPFDAVEIDLSLLWRGRRLKEEL